MKKQICFFGFAENEGAYGQAGWHYQSLVDVAKKLTDYDVYHISDHGKCFLLSPNHTQINEDIVLSLNPDYFICRAYFELGKFSRVLENSKFSTYIYAKSNPPEKFLSKFNRTITEQSIFKPVPNIELFKSDKNMNKKYIVSSGSFLPRKNHLKIVQTIDPEIIKDHTIVFCGKQKDKSYANQIKLTLESRGINYLIPDSKDENIRAVYGSGYISHQELSELYKQSSCFLLMSSSDGNPRALVEAILSGVPFVISKTVEINLEYEKFGIRSDFNSLNENLKQILHDFEMPQVTEEFRAKHEIDFFIRKIVKDV